MQILIPPQLLNIFHCVDADINILNYTENFITLSKNRRLCINNQSVLSYPKENCHLIIYNSLSSPDVICIEQQDKYSKLPDERYFIIKYGGEYIYLELCDILFYANNKNLVSQIPFHIRDIETFIKSDRCTGQLIRNPSIQTSFDYNISLIQFLPRKSSPRLTVLNCTDQNFEFDLFSKLYINGDEYSGFTNDNCQIIASHIKKDPEVICMEQQDERSEIAGPRLYADRIWKKCFDSSYYNEIMSLIHENIAFQCIWRGMFDENFYLRKNGLPQDIVKVITEIYLSLILTPPIPVRIKDRFESFQRF